MRRRSDEAARRRLARKLARARLRSALRQLRQPGNALASLIGSVRCGVFAATGTLPPETAVERESARRARMRLIAQSRQEDAA